MKTLFIPADSLEISHIINNDEQGKAVTYTSERRLFGEIKFVFEKLTVIIKPVQSFEDMLLYTKQMDLNKELRIKLRSKFDI